VMTGIAYRVSTVLKHGSSAAFKSLGYLGNSQGARYFLARVARMGSGHLTEDIQAAREKFPEIRTRMLQMDRDYKVGSRSMYESEDWRAKNERFGHMFVAWSDALSAIPLAWAAYDLAKSEGVPTSMGGTGIPLPEAQAVAYANAVVRQAHGSALETTRSNFMQSNGVKGLFGTIYGFMNNTYGQMRDMLDKSFARGSSWQNNPALVARAMATLIVPAVVAAMIKGGAPKQDDNKAWWLTKAIGGELAGTVPFVRDAASYLEYQQTPTVSAFRLITDALSTGRDLVHEAQGKESRLLQDLGNAVGEWAHIGGLGQLGHVLQYARDVHAGKKHPESALQYAKEATVGGEHHK